ncbi:hypothetical protein SNEBB_003359 [Seison nebaliae]|nr:hypothetical protein SNEBB_003359 [Seison nebaliae]
MKYILSIVCFVICVMTVQCGNWREKDAKFDAMLGCPAFECNKSCDKFGFRRNTYNMCRVCDCFEDPCASLICQKNYICTNHFHPSVASCVRKDIFGAYAKAKGMKHH